MRLKKYVFIFIFLGLSAVLGAAYRGSAQIADKQSENKYLIEGSHISGFNLSHCGLEKCIRVTAKRATQSQVFKVIAFDDSQVEIGSLSGGSKKHKKTFVANGYFDPRSERIYFTQVLNQKFKQAYFDLASLEFTAL